MRLAPTLPQPDEYVVTRWSKDEFSKGSYSYVPVGAGKGDYDRMAVPVTGDAALDGRSAKQGLRRLTLYPATRLYFAGEATHRSDAYTVHGAFLSGAREVRSIGKWWRDYHAEVRSGQQQQL